MTDYVVKIEQDSTIMVCFYIEQEKIMQLGERMQEKCENAYMNGYNWEAFLNFYLATNDPGLLAAMESDPEAGMYVAMFPKTKAKEADRLVAIIRELVENEDMIFDVLEESAGDIEWD